MHMSNKIMVKEKKMSSRRPNEQTLREIQMEKMRRKILTVTKNCECTTNKCWKPNKYVHMSMNPITKTWKKMRRQLTKVLAISLL